VSCVLPALAEFALLMFEHGPEVLEAIKAAFSQLPSNLSPVNENQLTDLKRELLQDLFLISQTI